MTRARKSVGRLSFVGTGTGDAGLLTVRAAEVLTSAEVAYVDAAVSSAVRALIAGEIRDADPNPGESIKAALTEARNGTVVARVVTGDPLESEAVARDVLVVAKSVVPYEVVPALSEAIATATYAGVALGPVHTEVDLRSGSAVDFESIAAAPGTLLFTLDAAEVGRTAEQLVSSGLKPDTALTVTTAGTTTVQVTVGGTLGDAELAVAGMTGPVVLTVGKASAARDKLAWWESRALFGWKILVPRTKEQAGAMSERLREYGAVPVEVPTIAVEPPRTPTQMERAIKGLVTGRYEWIVFTSTNAVRAVREKFEEFGLDARAFAGVKIACVGEQTAEAVRAFGIRPELLPSGEQSSEGLLADFPPYDDVLDPIDRVLLPRADIATETLAEGLRQRGWEIDDVTAYRTVRAAPPAAEIRDAIKSGGFQAVCFTSSSTVRNLVGIAGKPHNRTVVACIGPQTAATAKEFGLRVDVQPETANVAALIDALAEFALKRAEEEREKAAAAPARRGRASRARAVR
ncbi:bifunctional uroporphyrinogen-III C-methyltransferase/uroporphyrinogen-III synthase [Jatrophihabitans telluris]|uniref:Bifunctional uroporphyrinogen-III C-methyltransferase/uroporphyrinogen-III synthase n=1 Tax=Jatrophihabitans telluris TaxID=2038343 RepID=A0ABY4QZK6_9ACTN|nr:uroporphyrinogen-III synthase [Jatrophihabitans telluris]UQX88874.1 bifunctional uroporphyrinogen-III C-methyltransferase/uroporphyrinogen-III synthase [Jatrophihabitans telluris]